MEQVWALATEAVIARAIAKTTAMDFLSMGFLL
jgi:hypothetical protein